MNRIIMCPPVHFDVPREYEKNPWMNPSQKPDMARAYYQWDELWAFYGSQSFGVECLNTDQRLWDQVFTANLAWGVGKKWVLANFAPDWRKLEIKYAKEWFEKNGFETYELPSEFTFEGQGDIIDAGNYFLFCYGIRNNYKSIQYIKRKLDLKKPVVPLKLISNKFYHGDVSIRYLRYANTVLYNPTAFDKKSVKRLEELTDLNKMEAPEDLWVQPTPRGRNFPLNGCTIGNFETFPFDAAQKRFPEEIENLIKNSGATLWVQNFDQFGLSGAGHRCCTLFID